MKMKIPNTGSGNGYYGHESISYMSDVSAVTNGVDDLESPTNDGDFSEYMWMENEEEFEKEVMQQLEEEALMEQCIEAMLEDEREIRNIQNRLMGGSVLSSDEQGTWESSQVSANGGANNTSDLCKDMESLRLQNDLARQSTLNPNAAEFVPQQRSAAMFPSAGQAKPETS